MAIRAAYFQQSRQRAGLRRRLPTATTRQRTAAFPGRSPPRTARRLPQAPESIGRAYVGMPAPIPQLAACSMVCLTNDR